jgi:hypothetical protein
MYHWFNWQSVGLWGPVILLAGGSSWVTGYSGISFDTAVLLAGAVAAAGLLKQIELYGLFFLFHPRNFRNKYVRDD